MSSNLYENSLGYSSPDVKRVLMIKLKSVHHQCRKFRNPKKVRIWHFDDQLFAVNENMGL